MEIRETHLMEIPIKDIIIPENVRLEEREKDIISLMDSIKQNGLLQPIGTFKDHSKYVFMYGYRRIEAYRKLGYKKILSNIFIGKDYENEKDRAFINIIENVQRKDISPFELGRICIWLKKEGLTSPEISIRLGCPKSKIMESMNLYNSSIPEDLQENIVYVGAGGTAIKRGQISASTAHEVSKMGLNNQQFRDFTNLLKEKSYGKPQVKAICGLIHRGMSVQKAFDKFENWFVKTIHVIVNKKKLEKLTEQHNMSFTQIVTSVMKGEISYDRNLIH